MIRLSSRRDIFKSTVIETDTNSSYKVNMIIWYILSISIWTINWSFQETCYVSSCNISTPTMFAGRDIGIIMWWLSRISRCAQCSYILLGNTLLSNDLIPITVKFKQDNYRGCVHSWSPTCILHREYQALSINGWWIESDELMFPGYSGKL